LETTTSDALLRAGFPLLWTVAIGTVVGLVLATLATIVFPASVDARQRIRAGIVGGLGAALIAFALGKFINFGLAGVVVFSILGSLAWLYRFRILEFTRASIEAALRSGPDPALQASLGAVTEPVQEINEEEQALEKSRSGSDRILSKIFLSYASPDRELAKVLANALQNERWSVWWDRAIPPGKTFDEVIEAALNEAKCVIVLWSSASVSSDWVKNEAREGLRRRILIPALLADVTIPFEFRHIQAADLVGWPAVDHIGFKTLIDSIRDMTRSANIQKASAG
jgi:hypothetical protein